MHTLGGVVRLTFPSAGSTADLEVVAPDGQALVPLDPGAPVDGVFTTQFTPVRAGRYTYRWTDDVGGALADVFHVRGESLALCSTADVKAHLNMADTRNVDDDELRVHIEAATAAIERHRNEIIARRTLTAAVRGGEMLPGRPVIRVVSAEFADGSPVTVTDWTPTVTTGYLTLPRHTGAVTVTYVAGYEVVPDAFVLAAAIIAAHLWETQRLSGPPAGPDPTDRYLTPSGQGYAIPHRAVELLGGRPPVVA